MDGSLVQKRSNIIRHLTRPDLELRAPWHVERLAGGLVGLGLGCFARQSHVELARGDLDQLRLRPAELVLARQRYAEAFRRAVGELDRAAGELLAEADAGGGVWETRLRLSELATLAIFPRWRFHSRPERPRA